jgi:hypothetical protein
LRRRAVEPSNLSLLGLVRHLAEVERSWFRRRIDGQDLAYLYCDDDRPDTDLDDVDSADPAEAFAAYAREVELARVTVSAHPLDEIFFHSAYKRDMDVRGVYLHMIEEYARHNGHADLLRERIDGVTGD